MQGLIIATNIIGVLAISLAAYTAVIYHQVSKLDKERQSEFCNQHYKKILTLLIVNVIICAGSLGGYIALTIFNAESSVIVFPLISWFASDFSVIALSAFIVIAKKKKRNGNHKFTFASSEEALQHSSHVGTDIKSLEIQEAENPVADGQNKLEADMQKEDAEKQRQREERAMQQRLKEEEKFAIYEQRKREEERQKEERNKRLAYLKENDYITEKYAYTVENLIDKLTNIHANLFLAMFNQTNIPMASILVYPYKATGSTLVEYAFKFDGLQITESQNEELNTKVQNIIILYAKKLKEEIQSNNEWDDESTLPLLIYKIIRNNIIKHYHDKYVSECGYDSLEELCKNIPNPIEEEEIISYTTGVKTSNKILIANKIAAVWFIYYYIYEHGFNLPFVETYKKLCLEMKSIVANQEEERLKNELFGSHKAKVATAEKATRYISPIEKIDHMTGEEFELFMTQYFAEHGFKATHTPLSGDYGIDLILENDFVKIGVQAKCYSNKVTLSAIQEVVAGLRHYGLSSGMVVTNNYFQPSAIQLAKENNITLWDRNKLIEKLGQ